MGDVKILHASLEDDPDTKQIIIRGVIDQESLKYIRLDWYQREQGFSNSHNSEIVGAYLEGNRMADITLGMRGQRVRSKGDIYHLLDKTFCIDGGQRLWNAAAAVAERPDLKIVLGAKVFLGTTEEFENDMFCKLGTTQVRISPSIMMRNRKKKSPAARALIAVCSDARFALKDRVSWDQSKSRFELMNGYTVAKIIALLHAHKGGPLKSSKVYELLDGMDHVVERISAETFQQNIIRFFDALDKCWTIRQLSSSREPHPHLKPAFLSVIARLLSSYHDFWNDEERNEFYFPDKFVKRLRGLKLADYLHSSKVVPKDALYEILRKRLNLDPIFEDLKDAAE
jgi:hypothetical protein